MNLAKLAIDNSRITIMAILVIVVLGITTYLAYPSAEDPSIQIRSASVTASYPGMPTERVEDLITVPLEAAMREIAEIDEINSISKTGSTKLELKIREEIDDLAPVFQKIRNKAQDVKPDLPKDTQGPTVNDEEGLTAIATFALWSDGFSLAEMRDVARDTRDRLYALKGEKKSIFLASKRNESILRSIQRSSPNWECRRRKSSGRWRSRTSSSPAATLSPAAGR